MPCNADESAKIIKIYYLSLEYNFPSRNSENLGFPESVKEFKLRFLLRFLNITIYIHI
jgi:hypothetical protein